MQALNLLVHVVHHELELLIREHRPREVQLLLPRQRQIALPGAVPNRDLGPGLPLAAAEELTAFLKDAPDREPTVQ